MSILVHCTIVFCKPKNPFNPTTLKVLHPVESSITHDIELFAHPITMGPLPFTSALATHVTPGRTVEVMTSH